MTHDTQPSTAVEVGETIDRLPWSATQRRVLALAAVAVVLDGLDNQLLGFAIPALIADWNVSRAEFAPIVAASLIAMSVGTALGGLFGDRCGRRPLLVGSVVLFGAATGAAAWAADLTTLLVLRVIAAVGLGGAMPNATALLAEVTPVRRRSLAVTLGIIGVPIGGLLGGIVAGAVLPAAGWRALFVFGAVLPLLVAAAMWMGLPESPLYLARHPMRATELVALLQRFGFDTPAHTRFAVPTAGPGRAPLAVLFRGRLARETAALWCAFLACLLCVYAVFNWSPTLLAALGHGLAVASAGLGAFNLGGIVGALAGAWVMDRVGATRLLLWCAGGGAVTAAALTFGVVPLAAATPVIISFALLGAFVNGLQVMLFALAAGVYPAAIRATGVGAALAIGRLGAVVSAYVGALLIGLGPAAYFAAIAVGMSIVALSIGLMGRRPPAVHGSSATAAW